MILIQQRQKKEIFILKENIKKIYFKLIKGKNTKENENKLFNILFEVFPKEVVKNTLNNYFIKNKLQKRKNKNLLLNNSK